MTKRPLTPEEKRLWRQVTRHDVRLNATPPVEEQDEALPEVAAKTPAYKPYKRPRTVAPDLPTVHAPPAPGVYAGVDRNTAERFRRGKLPVEAVLDLHGYTREEAFDALQAFLTHGRARKKRCLLVITGKGKAGAPGVLRQSLPGWLAERGEVLAYDYAPLALGGQGAMLVLLRRDRQDK